MKLIKIYEICSFGKNEPSDRISNLTCDIAQAPELKIISQVWLNDIMTFISFWNLYLDLDLNLIIIKSIIFIDREALCLQLKYGHTSQASPLKWPQSQRRLSLRGRGLRSSVHTTLLVCVATCPKLWMDLRIVVSRVTKFGIIEYKPTAINAWEWQCWWVNAGRPIEWLHAN